MKRKGTLHPSNLLRSYEPRPPSADWRKRTAPAAQKETPYWCPFTSQDDVPKKTQKSQTQLSKEKAPSYCQTNTPPRLFITKSPRHIRPVFLLRFLRAFCQRHVCPAPLFGPGSPACRSPGTCQLSASRPVQYLHPIVAPSRAPNHPFPSSTRADAPACLHIFLRSTKQTLSPEIELASRCKTRSSEFHNPRRFVHSSHLSETLNRCV